MKDEIKVGVEFLRQFLAIYGQLNQVQIDLFASKLSEYLEERYVNHWYESKPMKGQAFRCLRLKRSENYTDPVLLKILNELNLSLNQLGLPNDFTLWIDPGEVSVRFGDQVGYTYSIAKLNKNYSQTNSQTTSTDLQSEASYSPSKTSNSIPKPDSKLIVQNSEKIFDEKLTAFIRQNSCNTGLSQKTTNPVDLSFNLNVDECELNLASEELIDKMANLSAEKRTISPPIVSSPVQKPVVKRNNSSNITITPNSMLNPVNRLSYNDSCYYSSSSSSCASSFGSNYDENLSQFGWFKNDSLLGNLQSTSGYFDNTNVQDQPSSQLFNSSILNTNENQTNIGSFIGFNSFGLNNNSRFNSDTSSDRSDTPNSCITNASSVSYFMAPSPSSFGNNQYSNFNSSFGFEGFLQQANNSDLNENFVVKNDQLLDSSSSSSTSTTIFPSAAKKESQTPKKGSDNEDESQKSAKSNENESKKSKNNNNHNNNNNNNNNKNNKDDSYCGYVESFPYYYKLNRLYNALALQKMQTERLRKAGLLNSSNMNNPIAVANALATFTSMGGQFSPNRSNLNTKNSPLSVSPQSNTPPSPQNVHNLSLNLNQKGGNKNGYPMSPTNAALSYANHSKPNFKNHIQKKFNYQQQQQQFQPFMPQQQAASQQLPSPIQPQTSKQPNNIQFF